MATLPEIPADSALARLFRQPRAREATEWFSLPGGQKLFGHGDPSDKLFFVRTGRLGAFRREEGQEPQFLGVIRPGEPAGEMALVAGSPTQPTSLHCVIPRSSPSHARCSSRLAIPILR